MTGLVLHDVGNGRHGWSFGAGQPGRWLVTRHDHSAHGPSDPCHGVVISQTADGFLVVLSDISGSGAWGTPLYAETVQTAEEIRYALTRAQEASEREDPLGDPVSELDACGAGTRPVYDCDEHGIGGFREGDTVAVDGAVYDEGSVGQVRRKADGEQAEIIDLLDDGALVRVDFGGLLGDVRQDNLTLVDREGEDWGSTLDDDGDDEGKLPI